MRKRWTSKEENILTQHYANIGAIGCTQLLARQQRAICKKARKLGLSTRTTLGGIISKKHLVEQFSESRGMVICEKHGCTMHYLSQSRTPVCLMCRRGWDKKRSQQPSRKLRANQWQREKYQKPIHNYANRLRRTLRFYSHGTISFSRHLPYSAQQLCGHLEDIKKRQANRCPMCHSTYDIVGYDIDHISPVFMANNRIEILQLFALDNLSLLCPSCNKHTKRDIDIAICRNKKEMAKCL